SSPPSPFLACSSVFPTQLRLSFFTAPTSKKGRHSTRLREAPMTWTEEELRRLYDKQHNEREAQTEQLRRAREERRKKEEAETEEREKVFRQMMEEIICTRPPYIEVPAKSVPPFSSRPSPKQETSFGGIFAAILLVVGLAMILQRLDKPSDTLTPTRIPETRSEPAQNGPDLEERPHPETPPPERARIDSPSVHTPLSDNRANNPHSDRPESISAAPPPSLQVTQSVIPTYPSLARQD